MFSLLGITPLYNDQKRGNLDKDTPPPPRPLKYHRNTIDCSY